MRSRGRLPPERCPCPIPAESAAAARWRDGHNRSPAGKLADEEDRLGFLEDEFRNALLATNRNTPAGIAANLEALMEYVPLLEDEDDHLVVQMCRALLAQSRQPN